MINIMCLGELAIKKTEEFRQCCDYGNVKLPGLSAYPVEMKHLLMKNDDKGRNFRLNIRSYNSALAFASFGASFDVPPGRGPYCFKVHGQIYHRIGPLHPEPGKSASYGQLYILDSAMALQERKSNHANEGCIDSILHQLDQVIRRISPFAQAYKLMHEVEQEEILRLRRENRDSLNYMMIF